MPNAAYIGPTIVLGDGTGGAAVSVTHTDAIPLDTVGFGKVANAIVAMTAARPLTVAATPVLGGAYDVTFKANGNALHIPTLPGAWVGTNANTFNSANNQLNRYIFEYAQGGIVTYGLLNLGIPPDVIPGQPLTLAAGTALASSVPLTWTAPVIDATHGTPLDYTVETSSNGGTSWVVFTKGVSPATGITLTSLTPGTAYLARVTATNATGAGPASATASFTTAASVVIADTFNRADAGVIGTRSDGGAWTAVAGFNPMGISANRAVGTVNAAYNGCVADIGFSTYTTTLLGIDYTVTESSFVYRYLDANNYCVIAFQGASTSYRCYEVIAGVATAIVFSTSGTVLGANSPGAGIRDHRFLVSPTSITVQNGVSGTYTTMDSVTHSTLGTNTKQGLRCNGAGAFYDSFSSNT